MKIAIDTSPVSKSSSSAHKVRGVGSYIKMLVENLQKIDKKNVYEFVEDGNFPKDADLIHYPYFDPFFLTLPLKLPKKFVVTVHDLTPLVFPQHFPAGIKGNFTWQVQKKLLRRADAVVADSDCSGRDIASIAKVEQKKIKTVYLAADKKYKKINSRELGTQKILKQYNLPEEFVLYVGDATWNKNLPRLIEAIKKTKLPLVLIGKVWSGVSDDIPDNPWNMDLKRVFSEIEQDQNFIRPGFVTDEDLVKIYNLARVLVMPSVYEGFGLPVLEAMSCGCPVVTTREGSLPEVGGNAVYYVDAHDSQNIADGILALASDEKLRDEFSKRGLVQAKKFTTARSIGELVKIYEGII